VPMAPLLREGLTERRAAVPLFIRGFVTETVWQTNGQRVSGRSVHAVRVGHLDGDREGSKSGSAWAGPARRSSASERPEGSTHAGECDVAEPIAAALCECLAEWRISATAAVQPREA